MKPSKNQSERVYHYFHENGPVVSAPIHVAQAMAQEGLVRLLAMAKAGDLLAVKTFHEIVSTSVKILNEQHPDFANSALEWPIVLPQDRCARNSVTDAAKKMRIGGVKAGGKGAGEKLSYSSDKGFAVGNLRRVSAGRDILRGAGYDGQDHSMMDEHGNFTGWYADTEYLEVVFHGQTGIAITDTALLLEIRDLPDYSPMTHMEWIGLIVKMLKAHPDMVPETIKARERTSQPATPTSSAKTKPRGGVVRKALREGLKQVVAVPGKSGDFIAD